MKSKSSYHRSENTFRFQTFHERLANVNVDAARRQAKFSATPEDADTFFSEGLEKWSDFNCTQHFTNFRHEIHQEVQTLTQVVHHQKSIVETLQRHLKVPNSLALQPLLDLVVQLARDLQGDFYPYFEGFLQQIVSLLSSYHDTEVLEWAFTCLAYLFKILWRCLVKDIHTVFRLFSLLLSSSYKPYIINFAAESFSFLMRKEKNHTDLFSFMFRSLEDNPDQASGIGRLLFEMMKGVQKQFHSSTPKVLPVLLQQLGDPALPGELMLSSLSHLMEAVISYTSAQHVTCVWHALLTAVSSVHNVIKYERSSRSKTMEQESRPVFQLTCLLKLLSVLMKHQHGYLLTDPEELIKVLVSLYTAIPLPGECGVALLDLTADLFLSSRCSMEVHHKLVPLIFNSNYPREDTLDFVRKVMDVNMFEKDLLPELLFYCHIAMETHASSAALWECVAILSELVASRVPPTTGVAQSPSRQTYLLNFAPVMKRKPENGAKWSVPARCLSQIRKLLESDEDWTSSLPHIWSLIYTLPHMRPLDAMEAEAALTDSFMFLQKKLVSDITLLPPAVVERTVFVTMDTLISLHQVLESSDKLFSILPIDNILQLIKLYTSNPHCLQMTDVYLTAAHDNGCHGVLTSDNFNTLFTTLRSNLSSPLHQVRLLTLHILSLFDLEMLPPPEDVVLEQRGVFAMCLAAEHVPLTVHTYRERLLQLSRLEHSIVQSQLPVGDFNQVPLQYLLGNLHTNFTYIWKPLVKLILSHAVGLSREEFWGVYEEAVMTAATEAEAYLQAPCQVETGIEPCSEDTLLAHLTRCQEITANRVDKPSAVHFRQLLWQAMAEFPSACEPKSRVLVPLLFRFLKNEYYPEELQVAPTQDIRRVRDAIQPAADDDEDDTETSDADEKPAAVSTAVKRRPKRAANKSLIVHLTLFARLHNPRSLYMEPQLHQLYMQLMQHKDESVQKVTFQCIMTYNHKFLTPYRENMERLLEDKSFKNEIVLFSLDETSTVIAPEHREGLTPVLMRLLYGRMYSKTGKDTAGKSHASQRKNLVMKFLAGSRPQEIAVFLDLVFEPFSIFMQDNHKDALLKIQNDLDLAKVIPLGRQQSSLQTIEIVMKNTAHLLGCYEAKLLKLVICMSALVNKLLEVRNDISPRWLTTLKTIRTLAHNRIIQFFETFEDYPFSTEEVDAIFTAMVWPQLDKLSFEGVYSPTPLLRLFITWSKIHRYTCLLSKCHPQRADLSPLPYICDLLLAKTVAPSVTAAIMYLVESLLTMEEELEGEESASALPIEPGSSWVIDISPAHQGMSYGTQLLLPHIPAVLQYLKGVAQSLVKSSNKRRNLPRRELSILSKLSEFVMDGEQGSEIIQLLLPFLSSKLRHRSPDTEAEILLCVCHLLKHAVQPHQFIIPLSELFCSLATHTSRSGLCDALQAVAAREPEIQQLADLVVKLNAWDHRRVDEPDYLLRLKGFDEARQLLEQPDAPPLHTVLMLVNNCIHFLSTTDDMSLRDSSGLCLRTVIKCLSSRLETLPDGMLNSVIHKHLLPAIKDNVKAATETVRHEFVLVLASLVEHFPNMSPFSELSVLHDSDIDVDFFPNITHIQHHRRARALRRLVKLLASSRFSKDILVSYFLPLIAAILRDPIYAKASNLHDAAVETLTALCSRLPWSHYQTVLKFELQRLPKSLENQKLMVRVVVAVLNGFHFDLSKSRGIRTTFSTSPDLKSDDAPTKVNKEREPIGMEAVGGDEKQPGDEMDDTVEDAESSEDEETVEDNSLDAAADAGVAIATNEEEKSQTEDGRDICREGLATRIHRFIVTSILPKLHAALAQKAKSDDVHKKASAGKYAEDEEILRVPIALAMIKLLQALPHAALHANLASVVMKVCQFLKSRSRDIRNSSRDTLLKMLQALGPQYFPYILKELRAVLTRGYQLHVLGYTVWSLLSSMAEQLQPGDLDSSMEALTEVFKEEMFGTVAEEKQVEGITGKLFEAKTCKSYDAYTLVARLVSPKTLSTVVTPLKEVLDTTHSHTVARKVTEALKHVCHGLVDNSELALSSLMTFTYGLTTEALPMLTTNRDSSKPRAATNSGLQPQSCLLLKPRPQRGNTKSKTLAKTNMHIVVEFGLQVLHALVKKGRLNGTIQEHLELLDPFVETLSASLMSKYVKVTAMSLRCLTWILRMSLPALKHSILPITNQLFVLLNNFAVAGAARGDNAEMVVMCFKTVTVIVKEVQYHKVSSEQLRVLLTYAEQDIHDHSRQATAFNLLKAILARRLVADEISDVMRKVEQLSISSEAPNIRLQSRQVVMQYLLDYPLGKRLKLHIEFYITQLEYEHESGRLSALEMLARMFEMFPQNILSAYCGLFFVPLTSRLVNDESTKCRQAVALAIKALLNKCDSGNRDEVFSMALSWMQSDRLILRRMAAIATGLFVEVESTSFERHLLTVLPILNFQIQPEKYDQLWDSEELRRDNDLHLYSFLNLALTITRECNISRKTQWRGELNGIWESVEKHLTHPHDWVRLVSAQLLGLLFSAWQPNEVAMATKVSNTTMGSEEDVDYLNYSTQEKLYRLCGACYKQLSSTMLSDEIADQIIKNLVYLAKVLKLTTGTEVRRAEDDDEYGTEVGQKKASLMWLVKRMCREANFERAKSPRITIKRNSVLKWMAAVGLDLGSDLLSDYLPYLLPVVIREFTQHESSADEELKRVSGEVLELLKGVVGVEVFSQAYASAHFALTERRASRKRAKATEAVANPEIAAKRKVKKNLLKEKAKKRKLMDFKPSKKAKRMRDTEVNDL